MKHVQHVMDHSGHSAHAFDAANVVELKDAEQRFNELTGPNHRMVAYKRTGDGKGEILRKFDPTAEETVFRPHNQGG